MQQQNYQPQQNEPDPQIPVDDWQARENRREEAEKKPYNIALRLLFLISLLNLIPSGIFLYYFYKQWSSVDQINPILNSLQYMWVNLNADPILEIQLADNGSSCPSDFTPLKLATWPGTVPGCLCDNSDLLSSPCSQVGSEKCKKEIPRSLMP